MKASLLPHLICPQCGDALCVKNTRWNGWGDIGAGVMLCQTGEHKYEIDRGVPALIPSNVIDNQAQVADAFTQKWDMVPDYGHDAATRDFQREWYLQRFGWETMDSLKEFLMQRNRILDAGCGLGSDVKLYAENTTGAVFGVDISDGVFLAQEKLGNLLNAYIIKADMTKLPFPAEYFDLVVCDQALHHTPDTHESFKKLLSHVKPGGHIAIYVYKQKSTTREITDDLIRKYTTEMSHADCKAFSAACAKFGRDVSKLNLELQRDIYWNVFKCYWNDDYDLNTNVAINFDWYRPKYAWRHTPEEVKGWCREAGLIVEHFNVCDSGISVRGYKPHGLD